MKRCQPRFSMSPRPSAALVGYGERARGCGEGVVRVNVNPDKQDARGQTPTSYASENSHEDVVKLLPLSAGLPCLPFLFSFELNCFRTLCLQIICRCGLCVNADPVLMGLDGDGHNAINWAPPARPAGFSVAGHISLCYKFVNFC